MPWRDDIHPESSFHKVSIFRDDWYDPKRDNRKIPYKVYIPRELDGSLPTVIWSHGLGGSRDGAGFISRYLAEHGFCVINIQHLGTDISLWMGKDGHPWDAIRATEITWQMTYDRLLDVPVVLDRIHQDDLPESVKGKIDKSRVGMSGHSFGSYTTQVTAGQYFGENEQNIKRMQEKRIKSALCYSQSYSDLKVPEEELYSGIDIPVFYMTGTRDDSPVSGRDYTYRIKVFDHTGADLKHLLVLDNADHMVFAGSRGQLDSYDQIDDHQDIIKMMALCWWEATLRDDQGALDWLKTKASGWLGARGVFK